MTKTKLTEKEMLEIKLAFDSFRLNMLESLDNAMYLDETLADLIEDGVDIEDYFHDELRQIEKINKKILETPPILNIKTK